MDLNAAESGVQHKPSQSGAVRNMVANGGTQLKGIFSFETQNLLLQMVRAKKTVIVSVFQAKKKPVQMKI